MAIQVNAILSPRIITVPETDGDSITIQSLVNQVRAWEDDQINLSHAKLLSAGGKDVLGGGVLVGITATLENAKLKFAERTSPTICNVLGGNLVALDNNGDPMSPVEFSDNVSVIIAQSSSGIMVETGVSGLTSAESAKLADIDFTAQFLNSCMKNKKQIIKEGDTWYFVVKNETETGDILKKALKDKSGENVTDIQAGALAQEMTSSV